MLKTCSSDDPAKKKKTIKHPSIPNNPLLSSLERFYQVSKSLISFFRFRSRFTEDFRIMRPICPNLLFIYFSHSSSELLILLSSSKESQIMKIYLSIFFRKKEKINRSKEKEKVPSFGSVYAP